MKYSIDDFNKEFPDNDSCLEYIFKKRGLSGYYRIKKEKAYCDAKGHKIYPLKGTIMENSKTPLKKWFYAFYLFSVAKNGISAKELERQLGVTYKCAYRIAEKIRGLMRDNKTLLSGVVEVDEAFVGGRRMRKDGFKNKAIVFGMKERGGKVVTRIIPVRENHLLLNPIKETISKDSVIISDELPAYMRLPKLGYEHHSVNHSKREYDRKGVNTNSIEGFWSYLKRNLKGTYCGAVHKRKLDSYLQMYSFLHNYASSPFQELLSRL